jgi:hypothetical protein
MILSLPSFVSELADGDSMANVTQTPQQLLALTLGWIIAVGFTATLIITLLALIGRVTVDKAYLRLLVAKLLLEAAAVVFLLVREGVVTSLSHTYSAEVKSEVHNKVAELAQGAIVPVGGVLAYAGDLLPPEQTGWMLCDGRPLKKDAYPELFKMIHNTYGEGFDPDSPHSNDAVRPNVGDFNLPDYRGRFLRGVTSKRLERDPGLEDRTPSGSAEKNAVGSLQGDSVGTHTHRVWSGSYWNYQTGGRVDGLYQTEIEEPKMSWVSTITGVVVDKPQVRFGWSDRKVIEPSGKDETRPKNIYVNWIIRVN